MILRRHAAACLICAVSMLAVCTSHAADSTQAVRLRVAAVSNNAAAVYWQAFDTLTNLTERQRNIIAGTNASPAEAAALAQTLQESLALQAQAGTLPTCDWGLDFSEGPGTLLPHLSGVRQLTRAANWEASYRLGEDPQRTVDLALANLTLSRCTTDNSCLISALVAVSCDALTYKQLAQSLSKLPAAQLARLSSHLELQQQTTYWARALEGESRQFVGWLLDRLLVAAHSNAVADAAAAESAGSATNRLARDLRLAAILQSRGQPLRIGFDDARHQRSFWLSPGQTEFGVTLVSSDYDREEAVIARDGETAVVHLKGLDIQPFELRLTLDQFRDILPVFQNDPPVGDGRDFLLKIGGPQGMVRDLLEVRAIEADWGKLTGWKSPAELDAMESAARARVGPLGNAVLMPLSHVYQTLFAGQVREQLMRAAIALAQNDATALATYPDPVDGHPFELRPTTSGYELVSRATSFKGEPVSLTVGFQGADAL